MAKQIEMLYLDIAGAMLHRRLNCGKLRNKATVGVPLTEELQEKTTEGRLTYCLECGI